MPQSRSNYWFTQRLLCELFCELLKQHSRRQPFNTWSVGKCEVLSGDGRAKSSFRPQWGFWVAQEWHKSVRPLCGGDEGLYHLRRRKRWRQTASERLGIWVAAEMWGPSRVWWRLPLKFFSSQLPDVLACCVRPAFPPSWRLLLPHRGNQRSLDIATV